MLLNVQEEEHRRPRLGYLVPVSIALAAVLIGEVAFVLYSVPSAPFTPIDNNSSVGLTASIGTGLFTKYLLPFEITSVLLLMAIVGAMTLARRVMSLSPVARVVPGAQILARDVLTPTAIGNVSPFETHTTAETAKVLGVPDDHDPNKKD